MGLFDNDIIPLETFRKAQRVAALAVFATHKPRIFESGANAEGGQIGTYVAGSKDKRKRNRGGEVVILSFTEQMKRDYQPNTTGEVGFGFSNQFNFDKATWNETRYKALIFALTDAEEEIYIKVLSAKLGFK